MASSSCPASRAIRRSIRSVDRTPARRTPAPAAPSVADDLSFDVNREEGRPRAILRYLKPAGGATRRRSEEHTSELQSLAYLVCRLLLEKKKSTNISTSGATHPAPF